MDFAIVRSLGLVAGEEGGLALLDNPPFAIRLQRMGHPMFWLGAILFRPIFSLPFSSLEFSLLEVSLRRFFFVTFFDAFFAAFLPAFFLDEDVDGFDDGDQLCADGGSLGRCRASQPGPAVKPTGVPE